MVPGEPQQRKQLYLPQNLNAALRDYAGREGLTESEVVRRAITHYLDGLTYPREPLLSGFVVEGLPPGASLRHDELLVEDLENHKMGHGARPAHDAGEPSEGSGEDAPAGALGDNRHAEHRAFEAHEGRAAYGVRAKPPTSIFVDTGGFIAAVDRHDRHHNETTGFLSAYKGRQVTTNLVVAETYTLLRYRQGHGTAVDFLRYISAKDGGPLNVVYVDGNLHAAASLLLAKYADEKLSYSDAVSLAWLERNAVRHVLGFDHHFRLEGLLLVPQDLG